MTTQLCCVKEKSSCSILNVEGIERNRLSELGFTKNTIVFVLQKSQNHGPILVQIRDSVYALRHDEAINITVDTK